MVFYSDSYKIILLVYRELYRVAVLQVEHGAQVVGAYQFRIDVYGRDKRLVA